MIEPKVSIIMGIYNCDKYLDDAIQSILSQTYENWELIMCDDGSTDRTFEIAEKYYKKYRKKIILLKNENNMGLNSTLNRCLEYATGYYIARQDADDISLPTRLEKEVIFLEQNPKYALVSANMIYFDKESEWGKSHTIEKPLAKDFIKGTPFCHAPCMIRKNIYQEVNGYTVDKKLLRVEDYHLWFKIYSLGYKGYNIQETLYKMRDDREAARRRNINNRINEAKVKYIGFKMLNIPKRYYIYILKPIIIGMLPQKLYIKLHRNKLKE